MLQCFLGTPGFKLFGIWEMLGVVSAMILWINLNDLTTCSANKIQGFDLKIQKFRTSYFFLKSF